MRLTGEIDADVDVDVKRGPGHSRDGAGPSGRTRLLAAARIEFARKGFSGTSVDDLVSAAGVRPPTLYYHFGDKPGLFVAAVEEVYEQVLAHFGAVDVDVPFKDAVNAVLASAVPIMKDDPSLSAMMSTVQFEIRRDSVLADRLRPILERLAEFFDDLAARAPGHSRGTIETRHLGRALIAIINGLNSEALLLTRPNDFEGMVTALVALMNPPAAIDPVRSSRS